MILRVTALLVLATGTLFLGLAAEPIVEQNRKVRDWPSVDATVTVRRAGEPVTAPTTDRDRPATGPATAMAASAAASPGVTGRAGADVTVHYRHEVNGTVYRSLAVTSGADEWGPAGGPEFVDNGELPSTRRARYDPQRPDRLFFPKALGLRDYGRCSFGRRCWRSGSGGSSCASRHDAPGAAPDVDVGKGWHRLRQRYSLRQRASAAWAWRSCAT
jgi:hypothetical protein